MPRIVKRCAIVADGQVVDFLHVAGVFQGDGGKIRKRLEQFQVARIEPAGSYAID